MSLFPVWPVWRFSAATAKRSPNFTISTWSIIRLGRLPVAPSTLLFRYCLRDARRTLDLVLSKFGAIASILFFPIFRWSSLCCSRYSSFLSSIQCANSRINSHVGRNPVKVRPTLKISKNLALTIINQYLIFTSWALDSSYTILINIFPCYVPPSPRSLRSHPFSVSTFAQTRLF